MFKIIIDRREERFFVCFDEEKHFFNIPETEFPFPVHEGDHLLVDMDENGRITATSFLEEETKTEAREVQTLLQSLRKPKSNKYNKYKKI